MLCLGDSFPLGLISGGFFSGAFPWLFSTAFFSVYPFQLHQKQLFHTCTKVMDGGGLVASSQTPLVVLAPLRVVGLDVPQVVPAQLVDGLLNLAIKKEQDSDM